LVLYYANKLLFKILFGSPFFFFCRRSDLGRKKKRQKKTQNRRNSIFFQKTGPSNPVKCLFLVQRKKHMNVLCGRGGGNLVQNLASETQKKGFAKRLIGSSMRYVGRYVVATSTPKSSRGYLCTCTGGDRGEQCEDFPFFYGRSLQAPERLNKALSLQPPSLLPTTYICCSL